MRIQPATAFIVFSFIATAALASPLPSTHAIPDPTFFSAPGLNFQVSRSILLVIGFTGQLLFSARVITQAWASKKRRESYTPPSYWHFSLGAATLLIFYCYVRSEPVGLLMQVIMSAIYARNIYLIRKELNGKGFTKRIAFICLTGAAIAISFCYFVLRTPVNTNVANVADPKFFTLPFTHYVVPGHPVMIFGFIGSAIFMGRFFVQWIVSERAGRSIVPTSFWVLASVGSIMLLMYYSVKSDPVNLVGQMTTLPAYVYNLWLIRKKSLTLRAAQPAESAAQPAV